MLFTLSISSRRPVNVRLLLGFATHGCQLRLFALTTTDSESLYPTYNPVNYFSADR